MRLPRILIGAASSGSGKTSLALGIIGALSSKENGGRGLDVRPFKVGPDYIDPGLHERVAGRPGRNLDPLLMGRRAVLDSLESNGRGGDIAVVEGVMGYYDGEPNATADLARLVGAPAILALDASAAAESCAATALGFLRYRRKSGIRAFILNRIAGETHYAMAKSAVERITGLPVLGYLPNDPALTLPERHLGLAGDAITFDAVARALAEAVLHHIDVDGLMELASEAPDLPDAPSSRRRYIETRRGDDETKRPIIAVARDEAFTFYYQDNFDILEALGAELRFFSPIHDTKLPRDAGAIYLGGGYPELFASALEANVSMRASIRTAADAGMPLFAECGGYLYLLDTFDDMNGEPHAGCGFFNGRARLGTKLVALGYRSATTLTPGLAGPAGTELTGHVFHYAHVEESMESPSIAMKGKYHPEATEEGASRPSAFGSFLHMHFAANPSFARRFVAAARQHAASSGRVSRSL